jgi:hypothetical protein
MSNRVVESPQNQEEQMDSPSGSISTGESATFERASPFDLAQATA